mgnify:CR=1 FL=1
MSSQTAHEELLDGEVVIHTREGSRKATYQVRFRNVLTDSPRYIRSSLKTSNRSLAIERALAMYREHHNRAFLGLKSDGVSIDTLLELGLKELKETSASMAKSAHRTYWSKYMGEQDLSRWQTSDVEDYFEWRVNEATKRPPGRYWKPSKDSVSVSTLKLERNLLRKLFQLGHKRNLIAKVPGFPERLLGMNNTHRLPAKERRGRFSDETYKTVSRDFRYIRRMLNLKKYQPMRNEEGTYDSWSKRNGIGSSKTVIEEHRWITKQRSRFSRAQYWFVCILIANTGIRPSEVVRLRHQDISIRKSPDDGKYYTVIKIDSEVSKVRKFRDVISSDQHLTFERYLDYRRELEFAFGFAPGGNDWLFPQGKDYTERIDRLNNLVLPHLKRIGLHKKASTRDESIEVYYSAYSFRAYYITKRLQNGLNIYTLAKNCGVSIQTLSSTYDYNENWAFRKQMTEHIGKWSPGKPSKHNFDEYEEEWSS